MFNNLGKDELFIIMDCIGYEDLIGFIITCKDHLRLKESSAYKKLCNEYYNPTEDFEIIVIHACDCNRGNDCKCTTDYKIRVDNITIINFTDYVGYGKEYAVQEKFYSYLDYHFTLYGNIPDPVPSVLTKIDGSSRNPDIFYKYTFPDNLLIKITKRFPKFTIKSFLLYSYEYYNVLDDNPYDLDYLICQMKLLYYVFKYFRDDIIKTL